MPVEKYIVEEQLKGLGGFHRFFTSKEIRHLPEILTEGETIHGITSGLYETKTWIIVITNMRLLFLDTGMFYGLRQVDIPLSQISSISHKTGFFFGVIEVATSSGLQTIGGVTKKDIVKVVSIISGLIHTGGKSPTPIAKEVALDLASQLERLAALRERGAITDDEFRLSKSKLLGS